jgi:chitodextrinase
LYTVAAFDAAGNTSGQSESGLVTTYAIRDLPDTTPPSAPANLSAAAISAGKFYLTWTASTDPVIPGSITSGTFGYDIYRNGTQIAATTSPSYLDIDLITVDHQYTYMVDAYDAQGNVSAMLAASSISTSCGQQPPGGPGTASIQLTFVPLIDTFSNLEGQVLHVAPTDYYLAVFIHAYYGWWTKPSWSTPRTQINCDGTWTCDITTGGVDETADQIAAYLFPKDYDAPLASGGSLPSELETHAVAKVTVSRK